MEKFGAEFKKKIELIDRAADEVSVTDGRDAWDSIMRAVVEAWGHGWTQGFRAGMDYQTEISAEKRHADLIAKLEKELNIEPVNDNDFNKGYENTLADIIARLKKGENPQEIVKSFLEKTIHPDATEEMLGGEEAITFLEALLEETKQGDE